MLHRKYYYQGRFKKNDWSTLQEMSNASLILRRHSTYFAPMLCTIEFVWNHVLLIILEGNSSGTAITKLQKD